MYSSGQNEIKALGLPSFEMKTRMNHQQLMKFSLDKFQNRYLGVVEIDKIMLVVLSLNTPQWVVQV